MNINELTPYKSSPYYQTAKQAFPTIDPNKKVDSLDQAISLKKFKQFMKNNGFTELGQGSFGTTYIRSGYPWVFKLFHNDPAYFRFFEFARANQNNPFLPKIKGKYIKINNDTYVVRLEKLRPVQGIDQHNEILSPIINALGGILSISDLRWKKEELDAVDSRLYDTLYKIYQITGPNDSFDLHTGNFMFRGEMPVITDPIFDTTRL